MRRTKNRSGIETMELERLVEIKKDETGRGLLVETDGYISIHDDSNKMLRESVENFQHGTLKELPKLFEVFAVFQKHSTENANGRIYPEKILKREADKYQLKISNRTSYGETNHPDNTSIDLERLAMYITELHWEGKTLVGKLVFPITEGFRKLGIVSCFADLMAHWVMSGMRIGVSSRGVGTVEEINGKYIVNDDYEIICWDVVANPSTPSAYIEMTNDMIKPYIEEADSSNKGRSIIKEETEDKFSRFTDWLNG